MYFIGIPLLALKAPETIYSEQQPCAAGRR
jgi:hypothetical protein